MWQIKNTEYKYLKFTTCSQQMAHLSDNSCLPFAACRGQAPRTVAFTSPLNQYCCEIDLKNLGDQIAHTATQKGDTLPSSLL